MALYITGDCHGDFTKLYKFIDKMELGEEDNIIVCGDMGIFWRHDMADFNATRNFYESTYKTHIYFVDGNHENFKLLNSRPRVLDKFQNVVGFVSPHIHHMLRGQFYQIDGKKILALGGAESLDKMRRTPGLSWWAEESITSNDIAIIPAKHYDIVVTHSCPKTVLDNNLAILTNPIYNDVEKDHTSEEKLEIIKNRITFDKWFFGHYHQDVHLDDKFCCLYNTFEMIE